MTETATTAPAHDALLYRDDEEFLTAALAFVHEGLDRDEPALAVLPPHLLALLGQALDTDSERVQLTDIEALGANPARILPAILAFIDERPGQTIRMVGQSSWPGRSDREYVEVARHEACMSMALDGRPANLLCTYDARALPEAVLHDAERTHRHVVDAGTRRPSTAYADPHDVWAAADRPLAPPHAPLAEVAVEGDVGDVRRAVREAAQQAGLPPDATGELLVAASEATANALVHGAPPVAVTLWLDGDDLITDVTDGGRLDDPLAGRRRPGLLDTNGRGLFIVNQLCDLVEVRSGAEGTTVRMRMRRPAALRTTA